MAKETRFLPKIVAAIALAFGPALSLSFAAEDDSWDQPDAGYSNQDISRSLVEGAERQRERGTPFRRRVMREDIVVRFKPLRLESGNKITLVYGVPKNAKSCPAVFVLDSEANAMANAVGVHPKLQS